LFPKHCKIVKIEGKALLSFKNLTMIFSSPFIIAIGI